MTRATLDRRRFKIIIIIIIRKKTLYLSLSLARVSVLAPQFFSLSIYIYIRFDRFRLRSFVRSANAAARKKNVERDAENARGSSNV